MRTLKTVLGVVVCFAVAGVAFAAVTFDSTAGTGFVGKGDVQDVFGWNNADLQANAAAVQFRVNSTVVTEVSWTCTNPNNGNIQERARTTTTTIEGTVASITRDKKNQCTGFILNGFDGTVEQSSTSEGQPLNSCPTNWVWAEGSTSTDTTDAGGLQVSVDGENWFNLE